jgi:hypothetical protein
MRSADHVVYTGEERITHRILVEEPEGKRPLGRSRHRWEDNTKLDLTEKRWGGRSGCFWVRID